MPTRASAIVANRIGPGHRTIAVPIRRQPRLAVLRFGSSSPNLLAITITAGASVNDATNDDENAERRRDAEALEVRVDG